MIRKLMRGSKAAPTTRFDAPTPLPERVVPPMTVLDVLIGSLIVLPRFPHPTGTPSLKASSWLGALSSGDGRVSSNGSWSAIHRLVRTADPFFSMSTMLESRPIAPANTSILSCSLATVWPAGRSKTTVVLPSFSRCGTARMASCSSPFTMPILRRASSSCGTVHAGGGGALKSRTPDCSVFTMSTGAASCSGMSGAGAGWPSTKGRETRYQP
jgi:hypothetical protein